MRAAVMTEFDAPLRVEEVAPAPLGPRQALVRIGASGLCHSDLLFWHGYSPVEPPIVLGHEVDYAFEVAGVQATLTAAYEVTRRGGTLVMVAIQPAGEFSWTPFDAVRNEKRVLGCWYGSAEVRRDFPRLMELAASGRLDIAMMITRRIALDDVNDGLAAIERGEVIRCVIVN